MKSLESGIPMKELFENTREIRNYILAQGYNYEEIWECTVNFGG